MKILTAALIGTGLTALLAQQAQSPAPTFEVASIRPLAPAQGGGRGRGGAGPVFSGDRLELGIIDVVSLITYAFRVKQYQLVLPPGMERALWTLSAKMPAGTTRDQAPDMMQRLLVDRFGMKYHLEKRERQTYTLSVAEGGLKISVATPGDDPVWDGSFPGFSFRGPLQSGAPITGAILPGKGCSKRWRFVPLPMASLADALSLFLNKPVVDQTGLNGNYRVMLDIPDETQAGMMANMMAGRGGAPPRGGEGGRKGGGPDAAGALPRSSSLDCPDPIILMNDGVGSPDGALAKAVAQLGLKLQPGRGLIDTVVIDHIDKTPTEN